MKTLNRKEKRLLFIKVVKREMNGKYNKYNNNFTNYYENLYLDPYGNEASEILELSQMCRESLFEKRLKFATDCTFENADEESVMDFF